MTPWANFMDHLLPDVPGCVPAMAVIALRHAAREFCERTKVWDVWLDPQSTCADAVEYDFEIDRTQEVVKLLQATLAGAPLAILSVNDLPADWNEGGHCPRGIFTQDRRTFNLLPKMADGLEIRTRVALKPSMTATGVEDSIFSQYAEDICTGAKARLMFSPKKPYTDNALALLHRDTFGGRCDAVARQVEKSFSRTPRRTTAVFF